MALPRSRTQREYDKFIQRTDGQTAVAVDIESADQGSGGGGGGNNTYYAKPSGTNADAVSAYASATTLTVTGLPFTFTAYDISKVEQIDTSGNVTTYTDKGAFSVSSTTITVSGASFAATDNFIVTFVADPRTENTPTRSTQTTRLNPDWEQYAPSSDSASSQTDGTTNYYYDISAYDGFSVQIEDTPGAAGTNTYKIYATDLDDGTALSSRTYQDITQYGMTNVTGAAAASYTADVFLTMKQDLNVAAIKVEVVRASDGGNNDGAWDIYTKRWKR